MTSARLTGFEVKNDGGVYLMVDLGAGAHRVAVSRAMLASIVEASAESASFAKAPVSASPPREFYVQVRPSANSRPLTYKTHFTVPVGSTVLLPPLPWRNRNWLATVISTERGDYDGEIQNILSATLEQIV
jgi:hypothetical protein